MFAVITQGRTDCGFERHVHRVFDSKEEATAFAKSEAEALGWAFIVRHVKDEAEARSLEVDPVRGYDHGPDDRWLETTIRDSFAYGGYGASR